jgi:hypothetical protein
VISLEFVVESFTPNFRGHVVLEVLFNEQVDLRSSIMRVAPILAGVCIALWGYVEADQSPLLAEIPQCGVRGNIQKHIISED